MKHDYVTHTGIVTAVSDGRLTLRTTGGASCDGCSVASLCNKAPSPGHAGNRSDGPQAEEIVIDTPRARDFKVGQRVEAKASSASTLLAAVWALFVPTVLFIATVLAVRLSWPAWRPSWSLLCAFGVLALYSCALYGQRRRLAARLSWSVAPAPPVATDC